MEEDMSSIVSNGGATGRAEATDSTGSMHSLSPPPSPPPPPPPSKRARHGGCRVSSSTKFKGVVPQQNGHWGAQIYANHQRIWLGTFKSEKEAAMAYDSAAIRIRNGDSHRNFPWTEATLEEPKFQDHHTTDQLLNMIKDGSYQTKFDEFLRARFKNAVAGTGLYSSARAQTKRGGLVFKQLFEKELTPSDVGKLNRLVIPKKYAVKHFPRIAEFNQTAAANKAEGGSGTMEDNNDEILLVFHDTAMRSWKFRYCYWKSSQSFVLTRGWNRFVKEKRLRENDTVTFYSCECSREGDKEPPRTVFVIDIIRFEDATNGELVERANDNSNINSDNKTTNKECVGLSLELKVGLKQCANHDEDEKEVEMELVEKANKPVDEAGNSGFRLFGVQIL